jgi:hypothetical protein
MLRTLLREQSVAGSNFTMFSCTNEGGELICHMYVCMYVCMYVFIYCKWTQVRWQIYIDINNMQVKIKHQQ